MSHADALIRGATSHVIKHLQAIEAECGRLDSALYAGAMLDGIRQYLTRNHGAAAAFEMLSGVADIAVEQQIAEQK